MICPVEVRKHGDGTFEAFDRSDAKASAPLISVIIPCFNCGANVALIARRLTTYLQNGQCELIVVDDGSTDESWDVLASTVGGIVGCELVPQENLGAGAARNRGIALAKGEWLMFVDADDELPKTALRLWLDAIVRFTDADIIVGDFILERGGETTYVSNINTDNGRIIGRENLDVLVSLCLSHRGFGGREGIGLLGAPWAKLYRRDFMTVNCILFDSNLRRAQDVEMNVRAFLHAREVGYLHKPMYTYRVAPDSLSHGMDPEIQDKLELFLDAVGGDLADTGTRFREDLCICAVSLVRQIWRQKGDGSVGALRRICAARRFRDAALWLRRNDRTPRRRLKAHLIACGPYWLLAMLLSR